MSSHYREDYRNADKAIADLLAAFPYRILEP
jgi:hypothetical protein